MGQQVELWKDVLGYEGLYRVSSIGNVLSLRQKPQRLLKPKINKFGYYQLTICNKKQKSTRVHRLVAEAFIPNPNNLPTVNHINGIKTDNRVENLEWMSYFDNNMHAKYTGLNKEGRLTEKQVREIYFTFKDEDAKVLAKKYGVCPHTIRDIRRGKSWSTVTNHNRKPTGNCFELFKGGNNPAAKKVIDTVTGEIFDTVSQAAIAVGANRSYLTTMLRGQTKNNTNLIYYDEFYAQKIKNLLKN